MWTFVIAAQLAVAVRLDSTYATPALAAVVARAVAHNRRPPPGLESYRAHVESELAAVVRRSDGTEGTVEIEQVASAARWRRTGAYEQHVIGYRAQLATLTPSLVGLVGQAWTVPVLYGNRLSLLFGFDSTRRASGRSDTTVVVMHPLAEDREAIYRYTGGDTVATLHVPGGAPIPLVRVHVEPRPHLPSRTVVFRGDLFLDATRDQLVRMRGVFALVGGHASLGRRLRGAVLQSMFVIDLTNAEIDGAYWLPADQRIEGQVASPLSGTTRIIVRVVSHYSQYAINDTAVAPVPGDTLVVRPHALTFAPSDSVTRYGAWALPLGEATTSVRAGEYDDLAPDAWRPTGPPRVDWRVDHFADFLHIDRVEGLYTGYGAALRFRDAAPGLVARANVGYAWTERTVRGGVGLDWTRADNALVVGVRAERALDNTNDFRTWFAEGPTIEALVSEDDYDYVDRRTVTSFMQTGHDVVVRVEAGVGDDRGESRRVLRPPIFPYFFIGDSTFRVNRGVLPGGYGRVMATVALHPEVDAGYATPGFGARLRDEWAGGDLAWNRVEARLIEREPVGPFTLLGRADAGLVTGTVIPPQQLFELGFDEGLTSYNYKQFVGDRAALLQGEAQYTLPLRALAQPLRLPGGLFLPGPTPALAAGIQSGWTELGTAAASRSLTLLDAPSSTASHGWRSSIDLLVRAFGGAVGVGAARAVGYATGAVHGRNWTGFVALGAAF